MNKTFIVTFATLAEIASDAKIALDSFEADGAIDPNAGQVASFEDLDSFMTFMFPTKFVLLMLVKTHSPNSLYELAQISGKSQPTVLRECKLLEAMGFLTLAKEGPRKSLVPRLAFDYDTIEVRSPQGISRHSLPTAA